MQYNDIIPPKKPPVVSNTPPSQEKMRLTLPQLPQAFRILQVAQVLLILLVLTAGGTAYYFYSRYKVAVLSGGVQESRLVSEVGKLVFLPEGETPKIATVTDPKVLSGQPFFKNAQVGDRVLLYSSAGKAVLYRPSAHKIVEIMPFTSSPEANK